MVLISIGTSPSLTQTKMTMLDPGYVSTIICRSALPLGLDRHVCPDYKNPFSANVNKISIQISSTVILRILFGSAFYKTIFLIDDYVSLEALIETRFLIRLVNSISCIDR